MTESKNEKVICKAPNCDKEVYKEGSMFCLEHERALEGTKKKAGPAILTVIGAGAMFAAKKVGPTVLKVAAGIIKKG